MDSRTRARLCELWSLLFVIAVLQVHTYANLNKLEAYVLAERMELHDEH